MIAAHMGMLIASAIAIPRTPPPRSSAESPLSPAMKGSRFGAWGLRWNLPARWPSVPRLSAWSTSGEARMAHLETLSELLLNGSVKQNQILAFIHMPDRQFSYLCRAIYLEQGVAAS
jgi:hypothetical protein